jgi:outer membrane receptor protein involved in Fe transport
MRSRSRLRAWLACAGVFAFATGGQQAVAAAAEDSDAIEEVVVTGSFIRRDNFDTPSPMDTMTELDIELAGTSDLGDMFFDQTYQFGVAANAAPFDGTTPQADDQRFNQGQEVAANIRGLGTRATMTMVDGRRLPGDANPDGRRVGVDINATYPSIAIGRVETILDGASALYGAEAVAGVVNLIPKKDFEGVQISFDQSQAMDDGEPTTSLQGLFGVQGERGGAIFAVEIRDQARMELTRRPDYILTSAEPWGAAGWTPWWNDANGDFGSPSHFTVPNRDPDGNLVPGGPAGDPVGHAAIGTVAGQTRIDPGCGHPYANGNDRLPMPDGSAGGPRVSENSPALLDPNWVAAVDQQGNAFNRFDRPLVGDSDFQKPRNFMNGFIDPDEWNNVVKADCRMTSSDIQDMQAEAKTTKAYGYFEYELNDYVEVRGEILISENDFNTRNFPGQFDEQANLDLYGPRAPMVIGDNPGNPFRAFADGGAGFGGFAGVDNNIIDWDDQNGDGLYDYLVEPGEYLLFAQDADANGFYERDLNGDGIPDVGGERNPAGQVITLGLGDANGNGIPDRFDPDAPSNVAMFEDVKAQNDLGVHPKQPRNNNVEWVKSNGGILHQLRRTVRSNQRFRVGTTVNIPNTDWIADLDYVWARGERTQNNSNANQNGTPEPLLTAYVQALRCQGGPAQDACWNPFSTTYLMTNDVGQVIGDPNIQFPDDNDPGWRPADAPEVNSEFENRIAGIVQPFTEQVLGQKMVDFTLSTGNLFELPWNDQPVGFAFGTHWREESEEFRPPVISQALVGGASGGLFSASSPGRRESVQTTEAVFAEFRLPLLESDTWGSMELQLAMRFADIETVGKVGQRGSSKFDAEIPKIAFRWAPRDWVAIRASQTEGFVTPGLFALFGEPTTSTLRQGVQDYLCNAIADIQDCIEATGAGQASVSGTIQDVVVGASPNSSLDAETSDLWNLGISLRLLDGDLAFDADFTSVEFNGRIDRLGAATNVASNAIGFDSFVTDSCAALGPVADPNGRTLVDHDNTTRWDASSPQGAYTDLTAEEFRDLLPPAELDCRLQAALDWVEFGANGGLGETPVGDTRLERGGGPNGLRLTLVEDPWLEQGEQVTETMIYTLRYGFDAQQIPWIGGDYGRFAVQVVATNMLTQEITRFKSIGCDFPNEFGVCPNDSPFAGITGDGVNNNNGCIFVAGPDFFCNTIAPLPPTPRWRINTSLRWFMGNHTAQIMGRWHSGVENIVSTWDEFRERGLLNEFDAARPARDVCSQQPFKICEFPDEQYWDISYTYSKDDFMGTGVGLTANLAIRNVFDNYPEPSVGFSSHNPYLDNIMGRMAFFRLSLTM